MILSHIVAIASNHAIGRNNKLLWSLPDDMQFFKHKTQGHCIISGRKNYESIPTKFRPLPNRTNIVVSRSMAYQANGAIVCESIADAITQAKQHDETECFIIGGGEIYKQTMHLINKIYLTKINYTFEADTFYPPINWAEWKIVNQSEHSRDAKHAYDFIFYELVKI
ncbi:MAG: hypothetical protein RIQ89_728 [Bacteroidota bacterium]|jgi:dihydrofolate reductase